MERNVSLEEISDGRKYELNDLVKADCGGCHGCSACCRGMGSSILLDPYDIYQLMVHGKMTFEQLLAEKIELNVVQGMILPNLKMSGEDEQCAFLNKEGRCMIHSYRPGICRIFPLGRIYEDHNFQYILQVHECKKENKSKIKVKKWIDIEDTKQNDQFIVDWHYFIKDVQAFIKKQTAEELIRKVNLYLLNQFYVKAYDEKQDFYIQFQIRLQEAKSLLDSICEN